MKSKSISANDLAGLELQLESALGDDFNPTLSIVFCHHNFEIGLAQALFKKHSIDLFGCTTSGEIFNNTVKKNSTSVLLLEIPKEMYQLESIEAAGTDFFLPGKKLGERAKSAFTNPAILVYSAGIGTDGESIVLGIKEVFDKEILIFGGMAADNFEFVKSQVFTNDQISDCGLIGLFLDSDAIQIEGNTFSGWNDLGRLHTITKAEGNVLFEVDSGQSALDLFNKYFQGVDYRQKPNSEELFTVAGVYALKINRNNGTEIMRSTLLFDFDRKALVLAGGVEEGETFRFCPTPDFAVVEKTINEFSNAKINQANAVIMTSCAARNVAFGPMFEDEVGGIYKLWNVPMVGLLAYGEIGNVGKDSVSEFHNVTCSIMTLSLHE